MCHFLNYIPVVQYTNRRNFVRALEQMKQPFYALESSQVIARGGPHCVTNRQTMALFQADTIANYPLKNADICLSDIPPDPVSYTKISASDIGEN